MTQACLIGMREMQGSQQMSLVQGWGYSRVSSRSGDWWLYHNRVSSSRGKIWGYTHSFITKRSWLRG